MKFSLFAISGLTALLIAGCSSAPTKVDKGPIRASSFSFVAQAPRTDPSAADAWAPIHTMIQNAITKNLQSKGLARQPTGGDVTVAYLIVVGNNANTQPIDDYFGYGRDVSALEEKAQEGYNKSKNPNYFEAGTLLVDILDSKTFKVLKRGYVVRPLLSNPTAEAREARIQEAVDSVLGDVRIGK